jgi:hypothetical protein
MKRLALLVVALVFALTTTVMAADKAAVAPTKEEAAKVEVKTDAVKAEKKVKKSAKKAKKKVKKDAKKAEEKVEEAAPAAK